MVNDDDRQPISALLQGARCMYRIYDINEKVCNEILKTLLFVELLSIKVA